jgi:UDP:flavonoid glycosyltransferase YjiC (YdhE family)
MARILCAWELGSELGHLSKLRHPVAVAVEQGHQVFLSARELRRAKLIMGDLPITYLQTPVKHRSMAAEPLYQSFGELLGGQCFTDLDETEMLLRAWSGMFDLVQPDLVLFEHAPTALAAAHRYRFKKLLVGSGFMVPPLPLQPSDPFAPFITTPRTPQVLQALSAADARLLALLNTALARLGAPPLAALADLYGQADHYFLMTWPLLDHFGVREGMHYLGVEAPRPQAPPEWPSGDGPRVFGYLQPMPALEQLLQDLRDTQVCALLCIRDLPPRLREAYSSERMRFTDQLVDLNQVAREAAWAINHANHNTVAAFMLAGLPQLVIPLHQEQLLAVARLRLIGTAVLAFQDQTSFVNEITVLNTNSAIRQQAAQLAAECASVGSLDAAGYIRGSLQALLA